MYNLTYQGHVIAVLASYCEALALLGGFAGLKRAECFGYRLVPIKGVSYAK